MTKRPAPKGKRVERKPLRHAKAEPSLPVRRPAPAPPPPVAQPPAEALDVFEHAMAALQKHDYQAARDRFKQVIDQFQHQHGLVDRAQVYLGLAERELKRQPAEPRTLEERLTAATAALNSGDDATAERLARAVLANDPRHDLASYLVAAVSARAGRRDDAIAHLTRAIESSPEIRVQARHDADFDSLHDLPTFRDLTEPPASAGGPRRPTRRPR